MLDAFGHQFDQATRDYHHALRRLQRRRANTAQAIAVGSFLLVDLLWVLATTQVVHPDMLGKAVAKAWTTAIAVAIGSAPWLAYIYRSRRVANTFNR